MQEDKFPKKKYLKLKNGMLLRSGPGISTQTIVLFAVIILWTNASNANQIRQAMKSALLHGEFAIMHSISIAFQDGLKLGRFVHLIIDLGNSKNMESENQQNKNFLLIIGGIFWLIQNSSLIYNKKSLFLCIKICFNIC